MEFSRPEYRSGQPVPSPGGLPNPGIKPRSPLHCRQILYRLSHQGSPSVQFSGSVVSNSSRPHESHHARPPCPSPTPGGQSTGVSALASFLPKKSRGQSPSEWTGWISLQSKGLKSLLQHHSSKASILRRSAFFTVQLLHPYMTTVKTIALTRWTLVGKAHSCSTLCDLMDCSTPDFPVLHYLPEFAPTHVH